jgi:D-alanine-D-alanine ligase
VIFGGPSPEHDVSVLTGLQAARTLAGSGSAVGEVHAIYWSKSGDFHEVPVASEANEFAQGVPRSATPLRLVAGSPGGFYARAALGRERSVVVDAVVNCCHGGPGEDGTLSGMLDACGIAHAGPSVAGAAIGMDKLAFGALAAALGLPVLPRRLLTAESHVDFPGPYVVKPRFGGSSIGIEVVADVETARARLAANRHLATGAVIEPFRDDLFDLNIAVRRWPELSLSAIERPIRRGGPGEIFSYSDKYVPGEGMAAAPRELPARLDPVVAKALRDAAACLAEACSVRGVARIDFLSDGSELYVNEINTIPGSLARHLWVDPEVSFVDLLGSLLEEAVARPAAAYSTQGADGSVLSSAGSIAAKLS